MALTQEQVAERVNYIGGSDAAAILGISRWKTPIEIWAEKTGTIVPEDISDRLAVEVGNDLEDTVAKLWTKRTGKKLARVTQTIVHPKYPFIRVNLDRRVVGEDSIFEAKTASAYKAKEWIGEDIPQEYVAQCMHGLAVTGEARCEIAVLIGGNVDFVYKTIYRDEKIIKEMIQREVHFWNTYVIPKVMPQIVTRKDEDILKKLFPNGDEGTPIALGEEANGLIESINALGQDIKNAEGIRDLEKNKLRAMLGEHTFGLTDRFKVSWRNQPTTKLDTEKLKIEASDVYEQFVKRGSTRVLRTTALKPLK